jgi:hypothetical protein
MRCVEWPFRQFQILIFKRYRQHNKQLPLNNTTEKQALLASQRCGKICQVQGPPTTVNLGNKIPFH